MIQLMVSRPLPRNRILQRLCLADPEALDDIARRSNGYDSSYDQSIERFRLILHDIRIGGAWKRTNRRRLKKTEDILCSHTDPGLGRPVTLLDIGASDGITTLEALRALQEAFGEDVQGYAADLNLVLRRYRRGAITEYRSLSGEPILVRLGRFGLRLAKERRGVPEKGRNVLREVYLQLNKFRESMQFNSSISMINPILQKEPRLMVIELDCLRRREELENRFSAVRVSNLLNFDYFSHEQIGEALVHIFSYLKVGGCLVISRNSDGAGGEAENGSVWLKTPDGFSWVADFGSGSEIRPLLHAQAFGWPRMEQLLEKAGGTRPL